MELREYSRCVDNIGTMPDGAAHDVVMQHILLPRRGTALKGEADRLSWF